MIRPRCNRAAPNGCAMDADVADTSHAMKQATQLHIHRPVRRTWAVWLTAALTMIMSTSIIGRAIAAVDDPPVGHDTDAGDIDLRRLDQPLEVHVTPGVYLTRLIDGRTRFGPASTAPTIDMTDAFDFGDQEQTFLGEILIRRNQRWDVHAEALAFSTEAGGAITSAITPGTTFGPLTLGPGDTFSSRVDLRNAAMEIGYTYRPLLDRTGNRGTDGTPIADLRFMPVFGARYIDVDHTLTTAGGTARGGGEWLIPYAGGKMQMIYRPAERRFLLDTLELTATIGAGPAVGGDGGFGWHVRSGLTWYPVHNVGLQFGYRLIDVDLERDEYRFRGGLQGVFFATKIRF